MRAYLKEIMVSLLALLILMLAVWAYIRSMQTEKSNVAVDLYTLIPPDVDALLVVNRPSVLNLMILQKQPLYKVFASEIPPVFLSFIQRNQQLQSLMLSFHSQGVVCYMQASGRLVSNIKKMLDEAFPFYEPITQEIDGIDYCYYADANNRFFGYYSYNGTWVGSYSKKLLEKTASQQLSNQPSLPEEFSEMRKAFDVTSPANIIFPTKDMNLYVSGRGVPDWRITDKWLAADLFVSEGNICCYGYLQHKQGVTPVMYRMMGDTISNRINKLYPPIRLSFQVGRDGESVYFTGCSPMPE